MSDNRRYMKGSECPEGRLLFLRLDPDENGKRTMAMAWPKSADLGRLKEAIQAAVTETYGANPPKMKSPVKDADTYEGEDGQLFADKYPDLAGHVFVNLSTHKDFVIVGPDPKTKLEPHDIRSGDYGRAALHAYTWENSGKKGVSLGFGNVQKLRDGEAIGGGGGSDPVSDFDDDVSAQAAKVRADSAVDDAQAGGWL